MRKLVLIQLCLTLAVPAWAEPRHLGTWVYGSSGADAVRVLRLKVRDADGVGWGTAVGTCYTPYLEVRKAGLSTVFLTITGSWADSTEADALFSIGGATTLSPTSGTQDYECYLVLSKPGVMGYFGADDDAGLFTFRARRWP